MYIQSVIIDKLTSDDFTDFYKAHDIFNMLDIKVSDVDVAKYMAISKSNNALPVHECVTSVQSAMNFADGSFIIRVNIMD